MKNDLNNLVKTLCCRLRFLWLHEAFVRFLQPAKKPYNILAYNKILNKSKSLLKRNSQKSTDKIFSLNMKLIGFMYCKTDYLLACRKAGEC
jgi:hypothetical protein